MLSLIVLTILTGSVCGLTPRGNQTFPVQATSEIEFNFDAPFTNAQLILSADVNTNYRIYSDQQYVNHKNKQTAVALAEVQNSNYTVVTFSVDPSIKSFWLITSAAIDWLPDETYYITVDYSTSMYFPILPTVLGVGIGMSIVISVLIIVAIVRHYRNKRQHDYSQL